MSDEGKSYGGLSGGFSVRALGIALAISLCLNFLIIGAGAMVLWRVSDFMHPHPVAGSGPAAPAAAGADGDEQTQFARHDGHGFGYGRGRRLGRGNGGFGLGQGPLNPHMLMRALPQKADAIHAVLRKNRKAMDDLRDTALAARTKAGLVLVSDDYTPQKLQAALDAVRNADMALEEHVLKTLAECANLLTPEERRKALELRLKKRNVWRERGARRE